MQVQVENYAQLRDLCRNRPTDTVFVGSDALAIYERNWRFVDKGALTDDEHELLDTLFARYSNGVLDV